MGIMIYNRAYYHPYAMRLQSKPASFVSKVEASIGDIGRAFTKWMTIPVRTYLHELGHSLAFSHLYRNAKPTIHLAAGGYAGGYCSPNFPANIPIFSSIGRSLEKIQPGLAFSAVAAAGPAVDIVSLLALSKISADSEVISWSQATKSLSLLVYAGSALFLSMSSTCRGHDFCEVWKNSGTLAYGALTAACLATHLYVQKKLHPRYRNSTEQVALSFLLGMTNAYVQFKA